MVYRRKKVVKKTVRKNKYSSKRKPTFNKVKMMVKQAIASNVENKTQQYFNINRNLTSVGTGLDTSNIIDVGLGAGTLTVGQGVGQGQRIGNTIKTKRLTFKGTIVPAGYDVLQNPQPTPTQVKMFIFYDKTQPIQAPLPYFNGDFYQNGSTNTTFSNDLIDLWRPVNTDRYRILATKTFKLGYAEFTGVGVTYAGAQQNQGNFSNNDFKMSCNFSFDLTKHYPKLVKFNDALNLPTTRGLYCLILPVWANGGQGTPFYMANVQYMLNYVYEDA